MVVKSGRYGEFLACVSPTCKNKRPLNDEDTNSPEDQDLYHYLLSMRSEQLSEALLELLVYLRSTHNYCYYCGAIYDDADQLNRMCPGVLETDH